MYNNKQVVHIVAAGRNGEIGANDQLLWHIREDLEFFKNTTIGQALIMGRKTIKGLPGTLRRRAVVPVSNNPEHGLPLHGALSAACDLSDALATREIYIAGGASIYKQTADIADTVLLTQVDHEFDTADTFYQVPDGFELKYSSDWKQNDGYRYRFTVYTRTA